MRILSIENMKFHAIVFFLDIFGTAKEIQVMNVPAKKPVCTNYVVVSINSVSLYNIGSL